jgi:hypothetical protein
MRPYLGLLSGDSLSKLPIRVERKFYHTFFVGASHVNVGIFFVIRTGTGNSRPATGHGGRRTNSGQRRVIDQPPPVDQPSAFGGSADRRRGAAPAVTVRSDDVLPVPTSSYEG